MNTLVAYTSGLEVIDFRVYITDSDGHYISVYPKDISTMEIEHLEDGRLNVHAWKGQPSSGYVDEGQHVLMLSYRDRLGFHQLNVPGVELRPERSEFDPWAVFEQVEGADPAEQWWKRPNGDVIHINYQEA